MLAVTSSLPHYAPYGLSHSFSLQNLLVFSATRPSLSSPSHSSIPLRSSPCTTDKEHS